MLPYRFELGSRGYCDLVRLTDGSTACGKVVEWADRILVFDSDGRPRAIPLCEVDRFELRRFDRHARRFELPDLTVAYVERLPRDPSWHGHVAMRDGLPVLGINPDGEAWNRKSGDAVAFRIHILNAGHEDSRSVPCRVSIDGQPVMPDVAIPPLVPGGTHEFEVPWTWQDGQHELQVEIDPAAAEPDALRWNNTFTQPTRALSVVFVVARDRYESFRHSPNPVDSFCFEDYAQHLVRNLNALFAASIFPSAPGGVVERVFCDQVVVVDDPLDSGAEASWLPTLQRRIKAGDRDIALAEYSAMVRFGKLPKDANATYENAAVNWTALQEIGAQLGLADPRKTETTIEQCYVLDINERFAMLEHFSPQRASLMHTAGGFPITEEQAGYLNRCIGRPRGFRGDYQYQLPASIALKIRATDGRPLQDAQVDVFQLSADGPDAGRIVGIGRTDPIVSTISGSDGIAELVNVDAPSHRTPGGFELKSNPFGRIAVEGTNGLLLLRLRHGQRNEEFRFVTLAQCNVAYLRGNKDRYVIDVPTRFAAPDASLPAPPFTAIEMWDRLQSPPPLVLTWILPKEIDPANVEEFRVYKRTGFAGQEAKPWSLVSVHRPPEPRNFPHGIESYFDEFSYDGPYSLDTFFAVSTVDKQGRESGLSEPGYIPYEKEGVRFAVDRAYAYMTARGNGKSQLFYWDGRAGTQPHQMKTDAVPGYRPAYEGIAFAPDGRMIVTDPVNHVLAVYDPATEELVEVMPRRDKWPGQPGDEPGEFRDPADIAIDDRGTMYVADRGNHRVQMLGSRGQPIGMLDPDFRFRRPSAVAYSTNHVCVTDLGGERCRVYDVAGKEPKFIGELPRLVGADRAVVNSSGRVFLTGRLHTGSEWTVLSFDPDENKGYVFSGEGTQGEMGAYEKPRSMYQHRGDPTYVYMMNEFPFDVRRLHIMQ